MLNEIFEKKKVIPTFILSMVFIFLAGIGFGTLIGKFLLV